MVVVVDYGDSFDIDVGSMMSAGYTEVSDTVSKLIIGWREYGQSRKPSH